MIKNTQFGPISGILRCALLLGAVAIGSATSAQPVTFWRMPAGAIQPQAVTDIRGGVYLIYFKAESPDGAGNLYYTYLAPGQPNAAAPIRVNSEPNTAGSVGTVRTAQISEGQDNRVHVVWNGLGPKSPSGYPIAYEAYTRLNDSGSAFEPQRNLTTWAKGLDGGGSVASDKEGDVYVTWHTRSPEPKMKQAVWCLSQSRTIMVRRLPGRSRQTPMQLERAAAAE